MKFSVSSRFGFSVMMLGIHTLPMADLEIQPVHFGTTLDLGQIKKSLNYQDGQPLVRSSAYFAPSAVYDGKLEIGLGMGGLFWYALPELGSRDRLNLSGFGLGRAEAIYAFGELGKADPKKLHMGLFDLKYNPDSKNLGEYLFRSGAYPTYIWTGGWSFVNSSSYLAQGFLLNLPTFGGKLNHDIALLMERNMSPTHDLSPAYLLTYKPGAAFEIGAGLVWANGLSFRGDSELAPRIRMNAYYTSGPNEGLPVTLSDRSKPGYEPGDTAIVPFGDPRLDQPIPGRTNAVYVDSAKNGTPNSALGYYTFKGFKAMARASVDFGLLFGMSPGSFKLYSEWAWQGIQNQPYYYDKPLERMPVMFGMNIPTGKILDMLSVELDYRKSVFKNTVNLLWFQRMPVPLSDQSDDPLTYREAGRALYLSEHPGEDSVFSAALEKHEKDASDRAWHWSIYAKKKIYESISLTGQVASDQMRVFSVVFGTPANLPVTERAKDWYYVIRLEFGI